MKALLSAITVGIMVEAALIFLFAVGTGVPHGSRWPLSAIPLFVHAPGYFMAEAIGFEEPKRLILVLSAYIALWSSIAFFLLRNRWKPKLSA